MMVVTKTDDDFIVDGTPLSMMDSFTRHRVAEETDDRELLLKLIHDDYWTVASAAANNSLLDSKTLDSLARDPSEPVSVRIAVARSNHVSEDTLSFLARNDGDSVRLAVAHHENTTFETLALLAKDKSPRVRKAVARHENTTVEILVDLSKDENSYVRELVAGNKNTTVEILALLAKDKSSPVRQAVARAMAKIMIEDEGANEKETYAG